MTHYDKSEYLETPEGQYGRYQWRKLRSRSYYSFDLELKSKNSMSLNEKIEFQKEVLAKIKKSKRISYSSHVIAELSFSPTAKNPPYIQTAVKNYLDLFEEPLADSGIRRKGLIYNDDKQIAALLVRYHIGGLKRDINARFASFNHFLQDLKLAFDILSGKYSDFLNCYDFERRMEEIEGHSDDDHGEDNLKDLNDLIRNKDRYLKVVSEKAYDAMLLSHRISAQENILKSLRLKITDLYFLYMPLILKQNDEVKMSSNNSRYKIQRTLSDWVAQSPIRVQLPSVPTRNGEKDIFKEKIEKSLEDFLNKYKFFKPLYIPINLDVIYKPPLASKGFYIDLDNMMRLILGIFNKVFEPTPTHLSNITLDDIKDQKLLNSLKEMIDNVPKSIKYSVSGYDIFKAPRASDDKGEGYITAGISSELSAISSHWYKIDRIIDEWIRCCADL